MKSSFNDYILYLLRLPLCDIQVFDLKQFDKHSKRKRNQEEGKHFFTALDVYMLIFFYFFFIFFDNSLSQPTVAYGSNLNSYRNLTFMQCVHPRVNCIGF